MADLPGASGGGDSMTATFSSVAAIAIISGAFLLLPLLVPLSDKSFRETGVADPEKVLTMK